MEMKEKEQAGMISMYLAKNRIRVIKRAEREQQLQEEERAADQDQNVGRNTHEAKQLAPVAVVKEWVNDYLRRRQHSFQEDV